jgi:hypothetical protein
MGHSSAVCIFGPNMMQSMTVQPAFSISTYLYLLPFELAMMTLGKAVSQTTFRPVFLILTLILVCDFSIVAFYSIYVCDPDNMMKYGWPWFVILYEGMQLQNYILFVYWYVWFHIYSQKKRETDMLLLLECGEFHGSEQLKTK